MPAGNSVIFWQQKRGVLMYCGKLFGFIVVYSEMELYYANVSHENRNVIPYYPATMSHFLDPPGNHPHGAIFPTVDSINQSMKRWLVYWIWPHDLFLRGRDYRDRTPWDNTVFFFKKSQSFFFEKIPKFFFKNSKVFFNARTLQICKIRRNNPLQRTLMFF